MRFGRRIADGTCQVSSRVAELGGQLRGYPAKRVLNKKVSRIHRPEPLSMSVETSTAHDKCCVESKGDFAAMMRSSRSLGVSDV